MATIELQFRRDEDPVVIETPPHLTPRPYQIEGTRFLLARKKGIIGDKVRLGKTAQALMALQGVRQIRARDLGWSVEETQLDVLVLCKKSAIHVWEDEPVKWGFDRPTVVHGTNKDRSKLWNDPWVVTTYETYKSDYLKHNVNRVWDVVICDEPHKKIRSRKTGNYKAASSTTCRYLFFLTGTPFPRGLPTDIFTYLQMIDPHQFRSYWRYVNTWCETEDFGYGPEPIGTKNVENFQKFAARYMIRRKPSDVGKQIEEPIRDIVQCEFDANQRQIHEAFAEEMMYLLKEGGVALAPHTMVRDLRYRQNMVSPKLIDPDVNSYGGAIEYIAEYLEDNEDPQDRHIVIFTPFPKVFPFLQERLEQLDLQNIYALRGGMKHTDVREQIRLFTENKGIMMCSTLFAQGFDLSTSDTSFMLGYDWMPDENEQAEGRLDSFNRTYPPTHHYLSYKDVGYDMVLESLVHKTRNINTVLSSPEFLQKLLGQRYAKIQESVGTA